MASKLFNKYWWIAKSLRTNQLQKKSKDDYVFKESDLFETDIDKRGGEYFLGYYSKDGINLALKKYGVYKLLKKRGFENIITKVDTSDAYKHKISIYFEKKDKNHLLIEVVLRKEFIHIKMPFETDSQGKKFESLKIDWMCMQDPLNDFDKTRPRLPGQKFPGLGFSNVAVELLLNMNWRLNLAGLINTPEHYHNARFYSKIFKYINPETQAKYIALTEDLAEYSIANITWAIDWGCVRDKFLDRPFKWIADQQIVPMDVRLKKLFRSKNYNTFVDTEKQKYKFELNEKLFNEMKQNKFKKEMEKLL